MSDEVLVVRPEQKRAKIGNGCARRHGITVNVYFSPELFADIKAEAKTNGWSLNHQIRHLCQASIGGIE